MSIVYFEASVLNKRLGILNGVNNLMNETEISGSESYDSTLVVWNMVESPKTFVLHNRK